MTSAIRETITDSLVVIGVSSDDIEEHNRYIDVAAQALQEREYEISDRLIEVALGETDYDREALENFLANAGLSVRPQPEPEPVPEEEPVTASEPGSVEDRVASLEGTMGKLVEAVQGLTQLAQRHLGTSTQ